MSKNMQYIGGDHHQVIKHKAEFIYKKSLYIIVVQVSILNDKNMQNIWFIEHLVNKHKQIFKDLII